MHKSALILLPLLLTVCLPVLPKPPQAPSRLPSSLTGYRKWVRVNAKPHKMNRNMAALCVREPEKEAALKSPHRDHWITVYVSPNAKQAMREGKTPFPRGSAIVKEKAPTPGGAPELLTVMHKREAGYNPQNGDWEYLVYSGAGRRVTERGRLASCQSCHARWRKTDFVSRAYLRGSLWYEGAHLRAVWKRQLKAKEERR